MRFSRLFWKLVIACTVTNLAVAGTAALLSAYGATWEVALAVVVGTGGLVAWLAVQIIQPVRSIASSAEAIAAGSSGHRVHLLARDELGVLARAVNHIQAELSRRGAQLATFDDRQLTVLDAMVEGVIAVDAAQRILLANPAAGR